ncbi:hypothetical protein LCGC14_3066850, partial [marine sediment metagenome]
AVIFDLDGCLVDSEPHALEAIASEMRALGIEDAGTQEIRDNLLGVSIGVICDHVAKRSGRPCPEDFISRFERRVLQIYRDELRQIEGASALLDWLAARGIAVAIATGGSITRMTETLRLGGLTDYFPDRAFSADQVARGKPAPDLALFAAARLGVAPEACVVFEDSPHGLAGAAAAGMTGIGFVGGTHLDGVRSAHAARLQEAGAHAVVGTLAEFREVLTPLIGTNRP